MTLGPAMFETAVVKQEEEEEHKDGHQTTKEENRETFSSRNIDREEFKSTVLTKNLELIGSCIFWVFSIYE